MLSQQQGQVEGASESAQTPSVGTPLTYSWVFWVLPRDPATKYEKNTYMSAIRKLSTFSTCEEFWGVYSRLRRPQDLLTVSDYFLFKEGLRPIWEGRGPAAYLELSLADIFVVLVFMHADQPNGGKWIVRLKKGLASRYWVRASLKELCYVVF
ncbi:hypothetical protein HK405_010955 [Cladochytrium tenue]|nr:hypothetical protein HK405_010955 [Cladochytrium tenue]